MLWLSCFLSSVIVSVDGEDEGWREVKGEEGDGGSYLCVCLNAGILHRTSALVHIVCKGSIFPLNTGHPTKIPHKTQDTKDISTRKRNS